MASPITMMDQYLSIKTKYRNCIVLFRLGDFYEMFFDDALIASKILDIALTKRHYGGGQVADMCGVPFHSADQYIKKLIDAGQKVAICEQMEDAKATKGIVKREVIRVITPGTVIDPMALDETKNNYICALYYQETKKSYGAAFADITTGEFQVTQIEGMNIDEKLLDELEKYLPNEIIVNKPLSEASIHSKIVQRFGENKVSPFEEWAFYTEEALHRLCKHFSVLSMDGYGLKDKPYGVSAAGGLLAYLQDTQKNSLSQLSSLSTYSPAQFLSIDASSRRNLELTRTLSGDTTKGTLRSVLDYTKTAMGARLLNQRIERPLTKVSEINQRLSAVSELSDDQMKKNDVKDCLKSMFDLERIVTKLTYQKVNARDMLAIKLSLVNLPDLKKILQNADSSYLSIMGEEMDLLDDVYTLIEQAIKDTDLPLATNEGGIIKPGYNEDVDNLRNARYQGKGWLDDFAERQKEETGIKNLKINNNKVFGYYIEVTKSYLNLVPYSYIRKQTLANCERFTTPELDELEAQITGADEKLVALEYKLFCEVREFVEANASRIQQTAQIIASVDVAQSFAEAANRNGYCRPKFVDGNILDIRNGRHPVVEKMVKDDFIPNDNFLDGDLNRLLIITGPNMAGKSTFMRQTALITLMAQIGSFVPADACTMSIVDKIYTRVGASDDLASGQSTFMVEMTEVANILNNATKNSLIILDEIGRGTSTFDGLSIAWAVLEYIADTTQIGAKTLFATHYHELTELEGKLPGVKNYYITVREKGDDIIFLRKIERGGAGRSLGVAVARLAGLPERVVRRSKEILKELNDANITKKSEQLIEQAVNAIDEDMEQIDLKDIRQKAFVQKVQDLDINKMTPVMALETLSRLQYEAAGIDNSYQ